MPQYRHNALLIIQVSCDSALQYSEQSQNCQLWICCFGLDELFALGKCSGFFFLLKTHLYTVCFEGVLRRATWSGIFRVDSSSNPMFQLFSRLGILLRL